MIASLCRGNVLDIGCGTGNLADYYFENYVGIDIAERAIEEAKQVRRKDAIFIVGDCSDMSKIDIKGTNTFVICEYLEHFEDDEKILNPIFEKAEKGSRVVISCPNGDRIPDPSHLRELTIPELRKRLSPYGKVTFYNWEGADMQIICTVDIGGTNDKDVSLVMIVKDEEAGIERAILSCLDFTDNIVVSVDSKSTDKTFEVAKRYADVLKVHIFDDDFSKARNEAHEGVTTKWIFFLDGHEWVSECSNLKTFLNSFSEGLLVNIKLENGFIFTNPRFYKTGVHFEGKIHEKQICKNVVLFPTFLIVHDRVGTQSKEAIAFRDKQRNDMVPRLMNAEIKKNPKSTRAYFHLGLFYQARGDVKNALFHFGRYIKYSNNPQERWFVLFHMSLCYLAVGHWLHAFYCLCRAEKEMPGRWETIKMKGNVYFSRKKYGKALECFVDSFHSNKNDCLYRPWARDESSTWNLIGECYFNIRNFDKAAIAFSRGADLCKDENGKKFLGDRSKLMNDIFKEAMKTA